MPHRGKRPQQTNITIQYVTAGCKETEIYSGWSEINQQDATNPMFIIKLLSQHVSSIIMPIILHNTSDLTDIRIRYQSNTTAIHRYTRDHTHIHTESQISLLLITPRKHSMAHILRVFPSPVTVQNTICSNTRSCSPDDGHNDGRNMLR